jgi:hypothetical protein
MKRLLVSATVFGLAAVTSVRAESPKSFLGTLDFSRPVSRPMTDVTCASFAGSWKGTCTSPSGDAPVDEAFTVVQKDCGSVEFDTDKGNVTIPVGGSFSLGGALAGDPAISFGGSVTSSWNAEHKVLSLYVMAGGKKLTIDNAGGGFFVKEDIQLASDSKLAVDVFVAGTANKILFCQFDKQAAH